MQDNFANRRKNQAEIRIERNKLVVLVVPFSVS